MLFQLIGILFLVPMPILSVLTTTTIEHPMLGQVTPIQNNDTALNFSFIFPANPQYAMITANYTLYEFLDYTNKSAYLAFSSLSQNCSVTVAPLCLSSAVPEVAFAPGHYVIGCFQWMLFGTAGDDLGTTHDCVLGRTTIDSKATPIASLVTEILWISNDSLIIAADYPAELPYDTVTVTPNLNGTISSTNNNITSNASYSIIQTFVFMNLVPNTNYWLCFDVVNSHSAIVASQRMFNICQSIKTVANTADDNGNDDENSSTINTFNVISMILLLIVVRFL